MIRLYHGSNVNIGSRCHFSVLFRDRTCNIQIVEDMTQSGVTEREIKYLQEQIVIRMIEILVEERGYSLEDAFEKVYTSPIYSKLGDARTGLFYQSPRYVLSYL